MLIQKLTMIYSALSKILPFILAFEPVDFDKIFPHELQITCVVLCEYTICSSSHSWHLTLLN